MTFENFDKLVESYFDKIRSLRDTKGKEYANSESDRLANFKEIAEELGITPLQVLLTYSKKHSRAIDNYCKSGGVSHSNEPIQSRILDRITYDLLLLGLIEDRRGPLVDHDHFFIADFKNLGVCQICGYAEWYTLHLNRNHRYRGQFIPENGLCVCGREQDNEIHN